jgi:Zn-dependent protease
MGKSLRIGRIAGTPISVNAGLAVLAILFVATLAIEGFPVIDPEASLNRRLVLACLTVAAFLASVLGHELGHASLAKRNGVGVLGITLSLLGGYAQLDRQAPTPRAEFLIAAAGPAVNLLIGAGMAGVTYLLDRWELVDQLTLGALIWLTGVNIVLALLNLFPAAPLDGGRVLTAALWKRLGDAELARIFSGRAGLILGGCLLIAGLAQFYRGVWQGLVTLVVAVFLFNGARGEIGAAAVRRRLQRTTAAELMIVNPQPVSDSLTIEQLNSLTGPERVGQALPVVRWDAEPVGYVLSSAGIGLGALDRSMTTVRDMMQPTPEVVRAWQTEPIETSVDRLSAVDRPVDDTAAAATGTSSPDAERLQPAGGSRELVVVHEPKTGRVVGTLSSTQVRPLFNAPDIWGRDRAADRSGNKPQPSQVAPVEQTRGQIQ